MEIKQIVYAILVVIVIIFAIFFLTKGSPLIKSILNLGDELGFENENIVTIKEKFDGLANSYRECFDSEKVNCICKKDFPRFPTNYNLIYSSSQTNSIISISKETDTASASKETLAGFVINCFAVLDKDEKGNYKYGIPPTSSILLNQDKSDRIMVSGVIGEEKFNDNFISNLEYIYKYDKTHLCLLLEGSLSKGLFKSVDEAAVNHFKNLPLCS